MPTTSSLISFRSVGTSSELVNAQRQQREPQQVPIGIKTPLSFGTRDLFEMNYSVAQQIKDNFRNLLATNHGERLVLQDYGANLRPLTAEWSSKDSFDEEAMIRINTAVTKWMPFVDLVGFGSEVLNASGGTTAVVRITVEYAVPRIGLTQAFLEIDLYVL